MIAYTLKNLATGKTVTKTMPEGMNKAALISIWRELGLKLVSSKLVF